MFNFLSSFMLGIFSLLSLVINTLLWGSFFLPTMVLKFLAPHKTIRYKISLLLVLYANTWAHCCNFILRISGKIRWDAKSTQYLNPEDSYLLLSNHRSWADIFVLSHIFIGRVPFMKFFLKRELIWIPILGIAWWALDYPFMKRYSKSFLKKHPHLKGKDMEMTRKFCRKIKNIPVTIVNFLEGTRFNIKKHQKQNSPYRHLLQPKAGGIAVALSSMGDYLSKILDITIIYPENKYPVSFWHLLKGGVPSIIVRVRSLNIPKHFLGKNYQEDKAFRKEIQEWVNRIWMEKDKWIEGILEKHPPLPSSDRHS